MEKTDWLKFIMHTPMEDGEPFHTIAEAWQIADYEGMWRHPNAVLIRPRGHDKTAGLARFVRAVFFLSERRENIFAIAADAEQGGILFADIERMTLDDPATATLVEITARQMTLKEPPFSTLKVMAHSAPTIMGIRPTMICMDELAEWRGRAMFDALYSASGKVKDCRLAVISVPPVGGGSVLFEVMELAKNDTSGRWYYSHRGQCATWLDPAWLADQKRMLPPHTYKRLHEAVQTEGAGAWLTEDEIKNVFASMPENPSGPVSLGVDIGVTRDRSFIAVVVKDEGTGLYCVKHLVGYKPRPQERIDLQTVEADIETLAKMYHATVFLDPHQGVLLSQRLQSRGVFTVEYQFGLQSRAKLFGTLLDFIRRRILRCAPHPDLKMELTGLEVKESLSGYRVDHKSGAHDDAVVATALALVGLPHLEPGAHTMPEALGFRETAGLRSGGRWENLPSPNEGVAMWRGGGDGGGINWQTLRW